MAENIFRTCSFLGRWGRKRVGAVSVPRVALFLMRCCERKHSSSSSSLISGWPQGAGRWRREEMDEQ